MGIFVCFPFLVLSFYLVWNFAGILNAATVSMSSYLFHLSCVWMTLFSWSYPFPQTLTIFLPHISNNICEFCGRVLINAGIRGAAGGNWISKCQSTRRNLSDASMSFKEGYKTTDPRMSFADAMPLHVCYSNPSMVSGIIWVDEGRTPLNTM